MWGAFVAGPYVRPQHDDPGADGSSTDLTVVIDELSTGLEDAEAAIATKADDEATTTALAGKSPTSHDHSGTYDPAGSAAAAQAAAIAASQPLDSDLTAIANLTTTSYGRAFLALADAAAARSALGLGTAATAATGDFDAAGAAAAAQAASQPLDSDLTAIAALTTTSFGRALLALADAAAGRTAFGLGDSSTKNTGTSSGTVAAGDHTHTSTLTTKGDLLGRSSSADARVAVGTNYKVLAADSAQTAGVGYVWPLVILPLAVWSGTLSTATDVYRWYNRTGRTMTVKAIWISVGTAPTGASILVDANRNGTTMFTTQGNRPSIAASGFVSSRVTNMDGTVAIADGDYLTFDIDQVGSSVAGSNLTVTVEFDGA